MMRKSIWMLTLLMLIIFPQTVRASGPGVGGRRVRLDNEPAGPYRLRAVTSPTPPLVENFNVEVRVEDINGNVIEDAQVLITARPSDHDSKAVQAIATHDYAPLPTEYAAHLPVHTPGLWEITIQVNSPLGEGRVSFFQQVSRPSSISAWLSVGAPLGGLIFLVLLFFWLQRQAKADDDDQVVTS